MEFEDLKVIWDSQNDAPLFAVNEEGLQEILRKKTRKFKRLISWLDWCSYGCSLIILAIILFILSNHFLGTIGKYFDVDILSLLDVFLLTMSAVFWVHFSYKIHSGKRRQNERERHFSTNLLGSLDLDSAQVSYQIDFRKNLLKVFLSPYIGAVFFMTFFSRMSDKPNWLILPAIGALTVGYVLEIWTQKQLIKRKLLPRKRELESLRAKLIDPENRGNTPFE